MKESLKHYRRRQRRHPGCNGTVPSYKCMALNRPMLLISTVQPQFQLSAWKREFPMLPQWRLRCPNWGCSNRARSSQCRSDAAPPFEKGLADSIFLLPDAVATLWQRHPKILNDHGASPDAAMKRSISRIRIYSCFCSAKHPFSF